MPIADSTHSAVLSALTASTWTQLSCVHEAAVNGFDTCDVVWIADFRGTVKTALQIAAAFPQGTRYGSTDFWLRSATPERVGANVWKVQAHYEGRISSDKPIHATFQGTEEVISIDSLTYLSFDEDPVNVRECSISAELGYVLVGTAPPTHLVGLAGTPAISPGVRAGFWGLLTNVRYNFPSGWIFSGLDADKIAGATNVSYCRESWQYIHPQVPL